MPVHLELIADTPEQLAEHVGRLSSDATVELTQQGDLYLSLDLRAAPPDARVEPDHPAIALAHLLGAANVDVERLRRQELAELTQFRAAAAAHVAADDSEGLAALTRVDERIALLRGFVDGAADPTPEWLHPAVIRVGDRVVGVHALDIDDPPYLLGVVIHVGPGGYRVRWPNPELAEGWSTVTNAPDTVAKVVAVDEAGVRVWRNGKVVTYPNAAAPPEWAAAAWTDLVRLAPVDELGELTEGARVVLVGDDWVDDARAAVYVAPEGTPVAHVVGLNNDCAILELPDGSEATMHPDRLVVVKRTDPDGRVVIAHGVLPVTDDPPDADDPTPDEPPATPDATDVPWRGVGRFGPDTCGGRILAVLADHDADVHVGELVRKVVPQGFTEGTVKATMSPLVKAGLVERTEPGRYRIKRDG